MQSDTSSTFIALVCPFKEFSSKPVLVQKILIKPSESPENNNFPDLSYAKQLTGINGSSFSEFMVPLD